MRCFIAIEIDSNVKAEIGNLIESLVKYDADVRWVKPDFIHLTIKFLGDVDEGLIGKIEEALKPALGNHSDFSVRLSGTGVFPDTSKPRVLWVGVEAAEELRRLQMDIDRHMEGLGFELEKRDFRPHLTIGRIKSVRGLNPVLKELRRYRDMEFGKIDVRGVTLMRSILRPSGAEYQRLFHVPLKMACSQSEQIL